MDKLYEYTIQFMNYEYTTCYFILQKRDCIRKHGTFYSKIINLPSVKQNGEISFISLFFHGTNFSIGDSLGNYILRNEDTWLLKLIYDDNS